MKSPIVFGYHQKDTERWDTAVGTSLLLNRIGLKYLPASWDMSCSFRSLARLTSQVRPNACS